MISGASTGIGRHAAETLARAGYTVLAGVRFQSEHEEIRSVGLSTLIPVFLDVNSHAACVAAVQKAQKLTEELSIPFIGMVNNAGILKSIPIEYHSLDDARKLFETNFFGAMDLTQLVLPLLRQSQGRIINLSSFTAITGF
jgi:NAD(P)-dependent dehydrogenase (short-subunit alcohol dehydrogenase family)